ncbi:MAG: hypothetical protein LBV67_10865 [Streptococcaceae bacterium]|jgi:hypothetical protein|nr:hypothetical protein [Streptococcaceae bacterium]
MKQIGEILVKAFNWMPKSAKYTIYGLLTLIAIIGLVGILYFVAVSVFYLIFGDITVVEIWKWITQKP